MTLRLKNNLLVISQAATGLCALLTWFWLCGAREAPIAAWLLLIANAMTLCFLFAGGRGWFERVVWLAGIVGFVLAAYLFVDAMRPRLAGGYADMVAVVGSSPLLLLQCAALAGVAVKSSLLRTVLADPQRCQNCGYDLTGNLSGVCPECGSRVR